MLLYKDNVNEEIIAHAHSDVTAQGKTHSDVTMQLLWEHPIMPQHRNNAKSDATAGEQVTIHIQYL